LIKLVNTNDGELIGARCTTGIKMAKKSNMCRIRISPSRAGRYLIMTVFTKSVMRRTAYKRSVPCHRWLT
jgi:hypothetical protein